MEKRGTPTVTIISHVFQPLGKSDAEGLGMADLPIVVVQHPVGGLKAEHIHRKADAIADQVIEALMRTPIKVEVA